MTNIITVKNLAKSFKDNHVLKGISFEVEKGSIYALLGANGAGKTTTVRILSTLMLPDAGEATVGSYDVRAEDAKVRSIISLTGQYAAVDELLTGEENMLMMGRFAHVAPATVKKRTTELLSQLDLTSAAKRHVSTYSGGMRRRLDLAISLLAASPVIFLDEPTTGLDPRSRQEIWRIIKDLAANGTTIFLTTQYLEEADQLAYIIAVLHEGNIVAEGTAQALKNKVGGEVVELTFADKAAFEAAQKLMGDRVTKADESASMVSIPTKGSPEDIRDLLNTFAENNIHAQHMILRTPTLDDVFMKLTETREGK